MNQLKILILFCFGSIGISSGQNIRGVAQNFWNGVNNQSSKEIIENGKILIDFFENNEYTLDSAQIEISNIYDSELYKSGYYKESLLNALKTKNKIEKFYGRGIEYADCEVIIALNNKKLGYYKEALIFNEDALKIYDFKLGSNHSKYATCISNIANIYLETGETHKSLEFNKTALDIFKKVKGEKSINYAIQLNNLANCYLELGEHKKAIKTNLKALNIYKSYYGEFHDGYATAISNMAIMYKKSLKRESAYKMNFKALNIFEKLYSNKHPEYAINANNIADLYFEDRDYKRSLEYFMKVNTAYKFSFGENHPINAKNYVRISNVLYRLDSLDLALEFGIKANNIYEKSNNVNYSDWEDVLYQMYTIFLSKGDRQKAINCLNKLLIITQSEFEDENFRNTNIHYLLAEENFEIENYHEAVKFDTLVLSAFLNEKTIDVELISECLSRLIDSHIELNENNKGKIYLDRLCLVFNSKNISDSLYISKIDFLADRYMYFKDYKNSIELSLKLQEKINISKNLNSKIILKNFNRLATAYKEIRDYLSALEYSNKAAQVAKRIIGRNSTRYVEQLIELAKYYSALDRFLKANEICLIASSIIEKYYPEKIELYANCLNQLAISYINIGNLNKSIDLFNKSLELVRKINGDKSIEYAIHLHNYASNLSQIGKYSEALNFEFKALEIKKTLLEEYDESLAISYGSISEIYFSIDNLRKAYEYSFKAIEINDSLFGNNHPNLVGDLSIMAGCLRNSGFNKEALSLNLRVLKIIENNIGKNNISYAHTLLDISNNCHELALFQESLDIDLKAQEIIIKSIGDSTMMYAMCLSSLSSDYFNIGNKEKSLEYALKASKLLKDLSGVKSKNYAISIENLAFIALNQNLSTENYFLTSYDLWFSNFTNNLLGLSKLESLNYKANLDRSIELLANYLKEYPDDINELYNRLINLNGIISSLQLLNKVSLTSKNNNFQDLIDELAESRFKLIKLREKFIDKAFSNKSNLEKLAFRVEELERKISNEFILIQKICSFDITKNLSENEVYIDITRFNDFNFLNRKNVDSSFYLVFITDSKDTIVDYVFIEDGTKIDQDLFDQYKQEATDPEQKTDLKLEKFYNYFWKPIADKIRNAKTIYVSLGGVYNNINLNTIYNPTTGKYLIEEKDIRIVNSARDFVLRKESEKKNYTSNTASLFGFPNFDGNTTVSADTSDLFASTRDLNSFWLDSLTRGGMKAKPLPATKTEVENISSTLKSKGWQVNSFLDDNASETNIKKQQSPRILHVATHGYFFQDIPTEKDNTRFLGMDRQQVVQDPMLRSCLLLTGANKTLKGETTTGENGLLSAAEASLLDLRETELVVLSACETGKGEVKNSEGVYGLRKAFLDAGAQNIIMSLWKVDDKVTQEFMSRFYEIWLNDETSIRETFNKTQLEIKAKYPQPYYWGAFILVGE